MILRLFRLLFWTAVSVPLALAVLWAFGALWFDFPAAGGIVAWGFVIGVTAASLCFRGSWIKCAVPLFGVGVVLAWWLTLTPRNDRMWQPDVAETAWAEQHGDEVTLHNVRHCDYRTEDDYTPRWETRTIRLSQLTGVDIAIDYWGSEWMAHPIVSFTFADAPPLAFSIETRKEKGESYSALGGIYRQFELICIVADERDVLRVRTNYRKDEDLYLYRTQLTPEQGRMRLLEYIATMNALREHPRWYHALTTNCTTAIRTQHPVSRRTPWDWRILVNGKLDRLFYEQGVFHTSGLPFPDLKLRARVNAAAQAADASPDFSRLIREGRPGFGS